MFIKVSRLELKKLLKYGQEYILIVSWRVNFKRAVEINYGWSLTYKKRALGNRRNPIIRKKSISQTLKKIRWRSFSRIPNKGLLIIL